MGLEWNGDDILSALAETAIEGGDELQGIAVSETRNQVNVATGELRDSVRVTQPMQPTADADGFEGHWGSGAGHAAAQEFGDRNNPGNPAFALGLARARAAAGKVMSDTFKDKTARLRE